LLIRALTKRLDGKIRFVSHSPSGEYHSLEYHCATAQYHSPQVNITAYFPYGKYAEFPFIFSFKKQICLFLSVFSLNRFSRKALRTPPLRVRGG
jgi:hypothetical protein